MHYDKLNPARRSLLAIMLVAVVIFASRATAEESGDAVTALKASNEAVLSEIIVTAQKRNSTIQDTPISMSAMTSEDLLARGITSAQGIAQLAPGVAVMTAGPGQAQYTIRGLSPDAGEAPTVGFYLDEISVTPPTSATAGKVEIDPSLFDMDRVEVLRGPQGTLYGAGSMGGTVKLVTRPAQLNVVKSAAETTLSGTQDGGLNYGVNGMLNLPLATDKIALRLVVSYTRDSGFIDRIVVPNFPLPINPVPGLYYGLNRGDVANVPGSKVYSDVNDTEKTVARVSVLIKPTEELTITPGVFYQKIAQGGLNAYDSSPGTYAHYQPFDIGEPFSDQFTVASLTINYDFNSFSVTSATGDWWRYSSSFEDATETWQNFLIIPSFYTPAGLGPVYATEHDTTRQFSEELRLASRGEGHLKWLLGGYFSRYRTGNSNPPCGGNFAPDVLKMTGMPIPTTILSCASVPLLLTQKAVFGNASYTLGPVTLTLGARQFNYSNSTKGFLQGYAFTGTSAVAPLAPTAAHTTGVLPLVNLSYSPIHNLMFYGSAGKGYREGAGIIPIPTSGPVGSACLKDLQAIGIFSVPTSYNPDTVWTYEAGEKGRFFDGRMTLNSDVYLTRWVGVQQPVNLECGVGFTTNGPDAEVKGAELELQVKLTEPFTLSQNIGYSHAAFTSSFVSANVVEGQRLFDSPLWTINTTLEFQHRYADQRSMFATATYSFVSNMTELTAAIHTVPDRRNVNSRIGIDAGRWSVALFANNLFNQRYPSQYFNLQGLTGPPYDRITTNQPRTAGVDVNVSF